VNLVIQCKAFFAIGYLKFLAKNTFEILERIREMKQRVCGYLHGRLSLSIFLTIILINHSTNQIFSHKKEVGDCFCVSTVSI